MPVRVWVGRMMTFKASGDSTTKDLAGEADAFSDAVGELEVPGSGVTMLLAGIADSTAEDFGELELAGELSAPFDLRLDLVPRTPEDPQPENDSPEGVLSWLHDEINLTAFEVFVTPPNGQRMSFGIFYPGDIERDDGRFAIPVLSQTGTRWTIRAIAFSGGVSL